MGNDTQDADELAVSVLSARQDLSDLRDGCWQIPLFERGTVAQGTWLPLQDLQVVPCIIDDLVPAKVAAVDASSPVPGLQVATSPVHCGCTASAG